MTQLIKALSSALYVGYLPIAPGTFGSIIGFSLAWFFYGAAPTLVVIFCLIGFLISKSAAEVFGSKDPQVFVLDEVCGMMLSVLWLPKDYWIFFSGFVLFRILDTLKPWPISRIQKNNHPFCIMWDDLAAGVLVNLILQVSIRLTS